VTGEIAQVHGAQRSQFDHGMVWPRRGVTALAPDR
jgi:hypothetical protein